MLSSSLIAISPQVIKGLNFSKNLFHLQHVSSLAPHLNSASQNWVTLTGLVTGGSDRSFDCFRFLLIGVRSESTFLLPTVQRVSTVFWIYKRFLLRLRTSFHHCKWQAAVATASSGFFARWQTMVSVTRQSRQCQKQWWRWEFYGGNLFEFTSSALLAHVQHLYRCEAFGKINPALMRIFHMRLETKTKSPNPITSRADSTLSLGKFLHSNTIAQSTAAQHRLS